MARQNGRRAQSPSPSAASVQSTPAAPELAEMEHDHVIPTKRPAEHRKALAGEHKRVETSISLDKRVRQYPGQMLAVSSGTLVCTACKTRGLQNIKSTIDNHVKSASHKAAIQAAPVRMWMLWVLCFLLHSCVRSML